jgi:hypothetical protein
MRKLLIGIGIAVMVGACGFAKDGAAPVEGVVTFKHPQETDWGTGYYLTIEAGPNGPISEVQVSKEIYAICHVHDAFPQCAS